MARLGQNNKYSHSDWIMWKAVLLVFLAAMTGCDRQAESHDRFAKSVCKRNLAHLYGAIQQYAEAHQGRMPDSWEGLVDSGALRLPSGAEAENPLVCAGSSVETSRLPSSKDEWVKWIRQGEVSYELVAPGKQLSSCRESVIVTEMSQHHLDGGFVLKGDGEISLQEKVKLGTRD